MLKKLLYAAAAVMATMAGNAQADNASILNVTTPTRVSVHDPSIVIGYSKDGRITGEKSDGATKVYYIFGSHRAWAKSTDMQNWTTFTNNLSSDYEAIFANDAEWAALGGGQELEVYDVKNNMWAPDVIWNKEMKKWCMYMSINGDNYYSSIVMLTAETLDGDWTRVGTVVYSGFTSKEQAQATDFYKVHNGTDFPSRYTLSGKYTLNSIDPCAFYDEDGNLWMTYGSWFGGLYMLRLDSKTGLRDYTYTYPTTDGTAEGATSDEYLGHKVAGGNGASGEASYIEHIGDKYYLFTTYGGLTATGGYNMRVFASENVLGPYTDIAGKPAIYSTENTNVGNLKANIGAQLMNYYQWDTMDYGYVAEGHNSAVVDDDGKAYLVYHTRATTWGEGHQVRVHQLFTNKDGALVAAPFEYRGETLSTTPFTANEVAGDYHVVYHGFTDYANKACNKEKNVTLNADGTVTGNYSGTWNLSDKGPYISVNITGLGEMKGVLIKQQMEGLNHEALCFSIIGNGKIPMWGYKSADSLITEAAESIAKGPIQNTLAHYAMKNSFNTATPLKEITHETGLSLSFLVTSLGSDWDVVGQSEDENYKLYLSILHYNSADFYEAKGTVSDAAAAMGYNEANIWQAFLNGNYYATVSFNADGTIGYYRNGVLMTTYAAKATPSWNDTNVSGSANVTPATIGKAVIDYYLKGQLEFTHQVYNIVVGYSVPYDAEMAAGINDAHNGMSLPSGNATMYNTNGQRVGKDYHGLVIVNGNKYLRQ